MRYNLKFAEALHKTDIGLDGIIEALGGEPPVPPPPPPNPKTVVTYQNGDIAEYLIEGELRQNSIPDKTNAVKVEIGYSVTIINVMAFNDCSRLTSITIPNSVTNIGFGAFDGCSRLTSITIPNSVTSISIETFCRCSSLTSIIVDPSNSVYDSRNNCNAIIKTSDNTLIAGCKNTVIPISVVKIINYAFNKCYGLTSITIPSSVTNIGKAAFIGCSELTSVTFDNKIKSQVQGMSNYSWNLASGCVIHCTDGDITI